MPPDGDLCEVCGAWLKENECSFCGAELPSGAAFCGECGNPVGGVTCPNCGTLSFFDYCPNCHAPLTEQVDEMVAALQQSEPHRRYFEAKQSYADAQVEIRALEAEVEEAEKATATAEASAEDAAILDDLKGLNQRRRANRSSAGDRKAPERQKVEQPAQKEEPKIKPEQVRQSAKKANQDALAERKQRLAALKQRQAELEQVIENPPARPKEFSSNQELRRYFMAVKPPHPKGWICDAFNVLHQDPMHCTKPGGGGRWVS